jgi:ribosome-associated protein
MTESTEIARTIAEVAADTLATDITLLDISQLSSFADVFVICSADNPRQLNALREDIVEKLKEQSQRPNRVEGTPEAGWIVLDYGDVIVHLMTGEQREFYRLESLWVEAPRLLVIQ